MASTSPVILLLVALISGGGVAAYLARANRDSVNVGASEKAVSTLSEALDRLDKELVNARARIAALETLLAEQHAVVHQCRTRIDHLSDAIVRLGGNVDDSDDVRDGGDRA